MKKMTDIFFPTLVALTLLAGCDSSSSSDNSSSSNSIEAVSSSNSIEAASSSSSSSYTGPIEYDVFIDSECYDEGAQGVTEAGKAAICHSGHWALDTTANSNGAPSFYASPRFISENIISIYENNTFVINIKAIIKNSDLTYTIAKGDDNESFEINATSGELSFIGAPDFETKQNYTVNVAASDTQGNSAIQTLNVIILDDELFDND